MFFGVLLIFRADCHPTHGMLYTLQSGFALGFQSLVTTVARHSSSLYTVSSIKVFPPFDMLYSTLFGVFGLFERIISPPTVRCMCCGQVFYLGSGVFYIVARHRSHSSPHAASFRYCPHDYCIIACMPFLTFIALSSTLSAHRRRSVYIAFRVLDIN